MKVEINDGDVMVFLRSKNDELAHRVVTHNLELPPEGYRLNEWTCTRRASSGRRLNLVMHFTLNDGGWPMDEVEAFDFFRECATVAAGKGDYSVF